MYRTIHEDLRRLLGQPVVICKDDDRREKGRVIAVYEDSVRILNSRECVALIPFRHIAEIIEPHMELRECGLYVGGGYDEAD